MCSFRSNDASVSAEHVDHHSLKEHEAAGIPIKLSGWRPEWAVAPGEILLEALQDRGMTQSELANRTARPLKTINEIVKGKAAITPETALQLERVLGISARLWTGLEAAGIPIKLYDGTRWKPDGPTLEWVDGPTRSSNSWRDMQLEALFEGIEDSLHDLERYVEDWRRGSRHAPNVCDYANQALPSILRRIGELRALITTSVKGES
jgi:addiction module HigA family antidote